MSYHFLITGGAGFIGSNYVNRLLQRGERVTVYDNLSRAGAPFNLKWLQETHGKDSFELVIGDVRDAALLTSTAQNANVIVHLASQVAVTTSVIHPREDFEINAIGTFNVLEAARLSGKKPIVLYASTNKVYGGMENEIVEELETRYRYADLPQGVAESQSLDTWVLSPGPVSQFTLLHRPSTPQDLVRTGINLSSRVVEHLFWFGRHAERCDGLARLLRVALSRIIDETARERESDWPGIAGLLARAGISNGAGDAALTLVLRAAVTDDSKPGLAANLRLLVRSASHLRELMSTDNWRTLNQTMRGVARRKGQPLGLADALSELDGVIASLMTLAGFALDGMTRDHAWRFLSLGRRIERLQWICTALTQALTAPREADLGWLLELTDSTLTYRARYMGAPDWLPVLDLLVRDETNPRSVAFQLLGLRDYVGRVAAAVDYAGEERMEEAVLALQALDPATDLQYGSARLARLLDDWYGAAYRLSEQLGLRFFVHAGEINRQTVAT